MPRALCHVASIFLNRLDWRRLNPRLIRQDPPLHNSPKSRRPRQSEEASTFCLIWLAGCLSPCQPLPGLEMFVQETNRFPSSVPIISALGAEVRLHDGIKSRSLRERRIEACLPSRCAYLNSQRRKTLFCAAPLALSFAPSSLALSLCVSVLKRNAITQRPVGRGQGCENHGPPRRPMPAKPRAGRRSHS